MSGARQAFVLVLVSVKGMRGEQEKYQPKIKDRLSWQIFQAHLVSLRNLRCLAWFEGEKVLEITPVGCLEISVFVLFLIFDSCF